MTLFTGQEKKNLLKFIWCTKTLNSQAMLNERSQTKQVTKSGFKTHCIGIVNQNRMLHIGINDMVYTGTKADMVTNRTEIPETNSRTHRQMILNKRAKNPTKERGALSTNGSRKIRFLSSDTEPQYHPPPLSEYQSQLKWTEDPSVRRGITRKTRVWTMIFLKITPKNTKTKL